MQTPIPCLFMRGGTSRGPFFNEADLPADVPARDRVLLAVMGSPDRREIDGLGGAHPLTSKVGIIRAGTRPEVDLEFLFAQVVVDKPLVDTTPNCGNMLAAVVPYALETGLVRAQGESSTFRVLTRNTDMLCDVTVQTPGGRVSYEGDARIDGVPGTSAPIKISFLDTAGSVCSGLLPTGRVRDTVTAQGLGPVEVTCIDNGMPLVMMRAADLGRTGSETVAELNADSELKARLEALRLACAERMGLGDVSAKTYPKMCLIAPPAAGGSLCTRCFIPHVCHEAIGVLAAVTVATACVLPGSIAEGIAVVPAGPVRTLPVEHPSGEFSVGLEKAAGDPPALKRAALLPTGPPIHRGPGVGRAFVWRPSAATR